MRLKREILWDRNISIDVPKIFKICSFLVLIQGIQGIPDLVPFQFGISRQN